MDYIIVDSKTGVQWAEGATFRDEANAAKICDELKAQYGNPDLVVKPVPPAAPAVK